MTLTDLTECEIPIHNSTSEICEYVSTNCRDWHNIYLRQYYCSVANHPILANIVLWFSVMIIIGFLFLILGLLASDYLVPNLSALSDALKMDEKLSGLTLLAFANGSPDILSTYVAMKEGVTSMAVGELLGSANFSLTVVIGVLAIYKPFKVNQKTFMRDLVIFSLLLLTSLWILYDGVITIFESVVLCLLYVIFIGFSILIPGDDYNHSEQQQQQQRDAEGINNMDIESLVAENDDRVSCTSVDSRNSNSSMNDYYFAHNIDNLEQGRGYKIALLDSIKLAWLYHRKTSGSHNEERKSESIQGGNSPKSPIDNESTGLLVPTINLDSNIEDSNEDTFATHSTITKQQNRQFLNIPLKNASPSRSRSNSLRQSQGKEDYQILYPHKAAAHSRANSFTYKSLDHDLKSDNASIVPVIVEPEDNQTHLTIGITNYRNGMTSQDSLLASEARSDILLRPERPALRLSTDGPYSNPDFYCRPKTPNESSSSSILIPYVEYNRTTSIFKKLVPTEMFSGAISIDEKILAVLIIPLSAVFNTIIPVSLPSELKGEIYDHELSISSKLFHIQIGFLPLLLFDFNISIPILVSAIVLPTLSIVMQYFSSKRHYQIFLPPLLALTGFFGVLKLITLTAGAVISVLRNIAEIYSLNESILGLTILSLGNSIGDVVTNLALAGLGRPLTGLHACFGSPLLYILFGIGICSLVVQLAATQTKSIEFEVDASLKLTAMSIVAILLIYTISLPLNGWVFQLWVGYVGMCMWFCVTTTNFVLHGHR
ncbi:hypothetical protein CANINC_004321 [Pichia inconspicua]|uniref:Sodium/calcium exchanger membrane region domain-containing protein n=1 Tax=Pichia inconspicua TaxID=52247 RepID=A0A4T0WXY0_9ASCO|nr:hypothetical protein CANINC_004321 [[Candida] inconspicua]